MIRIITARNEADFPTDWEDFEEVSADSVPMTLGLRFDKELAAMAKDGLFPGVNKWSEAAWKCQKFSADSFNKLTELQQSDEGPSADELAAGVASSAQESEDFALWMVSHPYYSLTVRVGIWAAVNMSGKHMTLREVYDLADRDFSSEGFEEPFIDDDAAEDDEVDPGKA